MASYVGYTNNKKDGCYPLSDIDNLSVIGNIYQNPELLKKEINNPPDKQKTFDIPHAGVL